MNSEDDDDAIRQLFRDAELRIKMWREIAETEKRLLETVPCMLECGYNCDVDNISKHIREDCPHRLVPCTQCNGLLRAKDLQRHEMVACLKRIVKCPNSHAGCDERSLRYCDLRTHTLLKCGARPVQCRLGCGSDMALRVREDHEQAHCRLRTVECHLCRQPIRACDYTTHGNMNCELRLLQCTAGCGETIESRNLKQHEDECYRLCGLGCGLVVGPAARRRHHELYECARRAIQCVFGCEILGLMAADKAVHEEACLYRTVACPLGCSAGCRDTADEVELVRFKDLEAHVSRWTGNCPRRKVICPSNLVGWRIKALRTEGEDDARATGRMYRSGVILKYERRAPSLLSLAMSTDGGLSFPRDACLASLASTKTRTQVGNEHMPDMWEQLASTARIYAPVLAEHDMMYIRFRDGHEWVDPRTTPLLFMQKLLTDVSVDVDEIISKEEGDEEFLHSLAVRAGAGRVSSAQATQGGSSDPPDDSLECGLLSSGELEMHLKCACPNRSVWIAAESDERIIDLIGSASRPLESSAGLVGLTDGSEVFVSSNARTASPSLTVPSPAHREIEAIRTDYGDHVKIFDGDFGKNWMASDYCVFIVSADHRERLSYMPPSTADLEASFFTVTSSTTYKGSDTYSTSRMLCCGQWSSFKDAVQTAERRHEFDVMLGYTQRHSRQSSRRAESKAASRSRSRSRSRAQSRDDEVSSVEHFDQVSCEFCALQLPSGAMDYHVRNYCQERFRRCPLGCGCKLVQLDLSIHIESECPKRSVLCDWCGDASLELWAEELDEHMGFACVQRLVRCPLGCGLKGLIAGQLQKHIDGHCDKRIITCSCGESFFSENSELHSLDCKETEVGCPQECGDLVKRKDVDFHIENTCRNKDEFLNKYDDCPLRCGVRRRAKEMLEHVVYVCKRRLTSCSNSCGARVRFFRLPAHLSLCPMRRFCCQPGMRQCVTPLFMWLFSLQGDNDLSRAISNRDAEPARLSSQPSSRSDTAASSTSTLSKSANVSFISTAHGLIDPADFSLSPTIAEVDDEYPSSTKARWASSPEAALGTQPVMLLSSVYRRVEADGLSVTLELLEHSRLARCRLHGWTAVMASVRLDDLDLAKFLIERTGGLDLNIQSHIGDTALTVACRMGKLAFVELFVDNGADVNLETTSGRTALIEACKNDDGAPIVLFLLRNGALASYKTSAHRLSALQFARRFKNAEAEHLLLTAGIMQEEIHRLFRHISCGELNKIEDLVRGGSQFHPLSGHLLQEKIISRLRISKERNRTVLDIQKKLDFFRQERDTRVRSIAAAEKSRGEVEATLLRTLKHKDDLSRRFAALFKLYEDVVTSVTHSDINELSRMRAVGKALRIALLAYGVIFSVLDIILLPHNALDADVARIWWPDLSAHLCDATGVCKSLALITINRFLTSGANTKPLMTRLPSLYLELCGSLQLRELDDFDPAAASARVSNTLVKMQSQKRSYEHENSSPSLEFPLALSSPVAFTALNENDQADVAVSILEAESLVESVTVWRTKEDRQKEKTRKRLEDIRRRKRALELGLRLPVAVETTSINREGSEGEVKEAAILDEEWDSDAEGAWEGEWVDGEWVGRKRKKDRWWEHLKSYGDAPPLPAADSSGGDAYSLSPTRDTSLLSLAAVTSVADSEAMPEDVETTKPSISSIVVTESESESKIQMLSKAKALAKSSKALHDREFNTIKEDLANIFGYDLLASSDKLFEESEMADTNLLDLLSHPFVIGMLCLLRVATEIALDIFPPIEFNSEIQRTFFPKKKVAVVEVEESITSFPLSSSSSPPPPPSEDRGQCVSQRSSESQRAIRERSSSRHSSRSRLSVSMAPVLSSRAFPLSLFRSPSRQSVSGIDRANSKKGSNQSPLRPRPSVPPPGPEEPDDMQEGRDDISTIQSPQSLSRSLKNPFVTSSVTETSRKALSSTASASGDDLSNTEDLTRSPLPKSRLTASRSPSTDRSLPPFARSTFSPDALGRIGNASPDGSVRYSGCRSPNLLPDDNVPKESEAEGSVVLPTLFSTLANPEVESEPNERISRRAEREGKLKALQSKEGECKEIILHEKMILKKLEKIFLPLELEQLRAKKESKFLIEKVRELRNRYRVFKLLNAISATGHTAMSWAASLGYYEAVDLLLKRGAPAGYTAELLDLCARVIQLSFQIYCIRFKGSFFPTVRAKAKAQAEADVMGAAEAAVVESQRQLQENESLSRAMTPLLCAGAINRISSPCETHNLFAAPRAESDDDAHVNALVPYSGARPQSLEKIEGMVASREETLEMLAEVRKCRNAAIANVIIMRRKQRLPIPEAVFTGRHEIVELFRKRGMYHHYFSGSWKLPCAPMPFHRRLIDQRLHSSERLQLSSMLAFHLQYMTREQYDGDIARAWIGVDHPRNSSMETKIYVERIVREHETEKARVVAEKIKLRVLLRGTKNRRVGEAGMTQAIADRDFRWCMYLVEFGSLRIDMETKDGLTALMVAAEENPDVHSYEAMLNDDGKPQLAVEYLLDRTEYRPSINLISSVTGLSALMYACHLGRRHVVEALLDRGADKELVNNVGRRALHYAAETGDFQCVRILLERGCEAEVFDNEGMTPFAIAEDMGFSDLMMCISQNRSGFYGPIRFARGRVKDTLTCPLGCCQEVNERDLDRHKLVCIWRDENCPLNCGMPNLHFLEIENHLTECELRKVLCEQCKEAYVFCDEWDHKNKRCSHRLIPCPLSCDKQVPLIQLKEHAGICPARPIECRRQCGVAVTFSSRLEHDKVCPRRRVPCKLGCGAKVPIINIPDHLASICPVRPANCQFCSQQAPLRILPEHESQCPLRKESCPSGCGEQVAVDEEGMKKHLSEACCHRFVSCHLGCKLKVREVDLPTHQETECEYRLVDCRLCCTFEDYAVRQVLAKELDFHEKFDCPKRLSKCNDCQAEMEFRLLDDHSRELCPKRRVPCSNADGGCLKIMPICELEDHARLHCRFRLILCELGCGNFFRVMKVGKHMNDSCEMRYVVCPQGCGASVKVALLSLHTETKCIRRHNYAPSSGEGSRSGTRSQSHPIEGTRSSARSSISSLRSQHQPTSGGRSLPLNSLSLIPRLADPLDSALFSRSGSASATATLAGTASSCTSSALDRTVPLGGGGSLGLGAAASNSRTSSSSLVSVALTRVQSTVDFRSNAVNTSSLVPSATFTDRAARGSQPKNDGRRITSSSTKVILDASASIGDKSDAASSHKQSKWNRNVKYVAGMVRDGPPLKSFFYDHSELARIVQEMAMTAQQAASSIGSARRRRRCADASGSHPPGLDSRGPSRTASPLDLFPPPPDTTVDPTDTMDAAVAAKSRQSRLHADDETETNSTHILLRTLDDIAEHFSRPPSRDQEGGYYSSSTVLLTEEGDNSSFEGHFGELSALRRDARKRARAADAGEISSLFYGSKTPLKHKATYLRGGGGEAEEEGRIAGLHNYHLLPPLTQILTQRRGGTGDGTPKSGGRIINSSGSAAYLNKDRDRGFSPMVAQHSSAAIGGGAGKRTRRRGSEGMGDLSSETARHGGGGVSRGVPGTGAPPGLEKRTIPEIGEERQKKEDI